jgi:putative transposase
MRFHTWLESEYHRSPHRVLGGKTPLDLWLEKAHLVIPIDPTVNLTEVFLHEEARKVHKDSTLTLNGVLYEVDSTLIGERIRLRYDPVLPPKRRRVEVFLDGRSRGEARIVDAYTNTRVRRANNSEHLLVQESPAASGPTTTPLTASLAASRLLDTHPKEESR